MRSIGFELVTLVSSWVPGALGLFLRSKLYPLVLGSVGRNVVFGVNVTVRHPHKIAIADNVVIDDACCLDAKGTDDTGIVIGTGVFVGRNTILSCKNGDIIVDNGANLGFNCEIFSASRVRVGKSVLMAAYTYSGRGDHLYDRVDLRCSSKDGQRVESMSATTSGWARTLSSPTGHVSAGMRSSAPARL